MHAFTQKETIAHRMYLSYGVRVKLALGAVAMRKARARATTRAGLSELAVVAHPYNVRGTFQSETDFQNELNAMRVSAHAAQLAVELHY